MKLLPCKFAVFSYFESSVLNQLALAFLLTRHPAILGKSLVTSLSQFPSAAFNFPRTLHALVCLIEEVLNLKDNPNPFCVNGLNQHLAYGPSENSGDSYSGRHVRAVPIWLYVRAHLTKDGTVLNKRD